MNKEMDIFLQVWLSQLSGAYAKRKMIFHNEKEELKKCTSIEEDKYLINEIEKKYSLKKSDVEKMQKIVEKTQRLGVKTCGIEDEDYPELLRNIYDPPLVLFYLGSMKKINNRKKISVVGSRKASSYGFDALEEILYHLKEYEVDTVSGGAYGIDSVCHGKSVKYSIKTYSVLGSGLDYLYPYSNKNIYDQIVNNQGAIISEFPVGTQPRKYNFPKRNRIISGMSMLLLIIEAGEKSGTLITLGQALQQGRHAMAVPGSIFSENSKGCNRIISEGAYVYNDISDIVEILDLQKRIDSSSCEENNEEVKKIGEVISDVPKHFDEIKRDTGIDIRSLYGVLFEMQQNEQIKCINGNFYVKSWSGKK